MVDGGVRVVECGVGQSYGGEVEGEGDGRDDEAGRDMGEAGKAENDCECVGDEADVGVECGDRRGF